jgi:signal transduction histidine kinase
VNQPRRVSRFERRILLSVFLSGLVPFVISLFFIPLIVEAHYSLFVHEEVVLQLEASAVFYKEFFDTKKSEFAARAETMSKDPVLLRAASMDDAESTQARIRQFVEDSPDVRRIGVRSGTGAILGEVAGPAERATDEFVPKTLALPLGLGETAPRLEVEFIFPRRFLEDRERAEEIATIYGTAVKFGSTFEQEQLRTYILIISIVLLLALGLSYSLARRVTKRIAALAGATERVASGDLDFSIRAGGQDEITELTLAFNKMIEEVRGARDRIVYLEKVSGWQDIARRLAHEIKNPLTPIQLAIQELHRRVPESDPRFKQLVEDAASMVEEEISALTRLVDEFSQFARLPEVVAEELSLSEFIDEFLKSYNRFEPDAVVEVEMPEEPVRALIDRVLMRRVLTNLAENAIQAAGSGQTRLRISAKSTGPNEEIELSIEDNGPGISAQEARSIFEPYFTTKDTGTGLGLAIVKKIVLQHGGSIRVSASPLGGAAFTIVLPSAARAQRLLERASARPSKADGPLPDANERS